MKEDPSMIDYLVGLILKYVYRVIALALALCLIFEVLARVEDVNLDGYGSFYLPKLLSDILAPASGGDGAERSFLMMQNAALESMKVWGLVLLLVVGVGLPVGVMTGRAYCAGGWGAGLWRLAARLVSLVLLIPLWIPAFGMAALLVLYLINGQGLPVYALLEQKVPNFEGVDSRVVEWWRHLLPAMVVAVCGSAWLVREVATILQETQSRAFVENARERGIGGDRLFFRYTMKYSIESIGLALMRSLPFLMGSQILVEWVFRFPGLGSMLVNISSEGGLVPLLPVGIALAGMGMVAGFLIEFFLGCCDRGVRKAGGLGYRECKLEKAILQQFRRQRMVCINRLKRAWVFVLLLAALLWGMHMLEVFLAAYPFTQLVLDENIHRLFLGASGTFSLALMSSALAVLLSLFLASIPVLLGGLNFYRVYADLHAPLVFLPPVYWLFIALVMVGSYNSLWVFTCFVGVLGADRFCKEILTLERQGWVASARAQGWNQRSIYMRHVMPAIWPLFFSRILQWLPGMMLMLVVADFTVLDPSAGGENRWGFLLKEGMREMLGDPGLLYLSLVALTGLMLLTAVLANWSRPVNSGQSNPGII